MQNRLRWFIVCYLVLKGCHTLRPSWRWAICCSICCVDCIICCCSWMELGLPGVGLSSDSIILWFNSVRSLQLCDCFTSVYNRSRYLCSFKPSQYQANTRPPGSRISLKDGPVAFSQFGEHSWARESAWLGLLWVGVRLKLALSCLLFDASKNFRNPCFATRPLPSSFPASGLSQTSKSLTKSVLATISLGPQNSKWLKPYCLQRLQKLLFAVTCVTWCPKYMIAHDMPWLLQNHVLRLHRPCFHSPQFLKRPNRRAAPVQPVIHFPLVRLGLVDGRFFLSNSLSFADAASGKLLVLGWVMSTPLNIFSRGTVKRFKNPLFEAFNSFQLAVQHTPATPANHSSEASPALRNSEKDLVPSCAGLRDLSAQKGVRLLMMSLTMSFFLIVFFFLYFFFFYYFYFFFCFSFFFLLLSLLKATYLSTSTVVASLVIIVVKDCCRYRWRRKRKNKSMTMMMLFPFFLLLLFLPWFLVEVVRLLWLLSLSVFFQPETHIKTEYTWGMRGGRKVGIF